jgi:hypothetical protein
LSLRERKKQEVAENCAMRSFISCTMFETRRMKRAGHVAHIGEMRNTYKILILNSEGKRTLRRPGCR